MTAFPSNYTFLHMMRETKDSYIIYPFYKKHNKKIRELPINSRIYRKIT